MDAVEVATRARSHGPAPRAAEPGIFLAATRRYAGDGHRGKPVAPCAARGILLVNHATREMRRENQGEACLHETHDLPPGWQGHLYRGSLERLKAHGVEHLVMAFPQIMIDSVLSLAELPNQIGKEIGWHSWARIEVLDLTSDPEIGHPFADYRGNWVNTECPGRSGSGSGTESCYSEMGGSAVGRPYPAPRTTPPTNHATTWNRRWRLMSRSSVTSAMTPCAAIPTRNGRCRSSTTAPGTCGSRRTMTWQSQLCWPTP